MSDAAEPKMRRKRHWLVRVIRILGVLAVAAVIVYLVADQVLAYQLRQRQAVFTERFGTLDYQAYIPERPPADQDAGRAYRYALGLMAEVQKEQGDWDMYHALVDGPESFEKRGSSTPLPTEAEIDTMVRAKIAAMAEGYAAAAEARNLKEGSVMASYDMKGDLHPGLDEARQLARNFAACAMVEARDGDLNAACAWLESGLHLAGTMNNDPLIIIALVRFAIVELTLNTAEIVFNTTDASLPVSDQFVTLLDEVSSPSAFARAVLGEAALTLDNQSASSLPGPLWSLTLKKLLDMYESQIDIIQSERTVQRATQLHKATMSGPDGPGLGPGPIADMLGGAIAATLQTYDRMAVHADLLRVAVALREYKVAHGAYPESLDAIAATYPGPLPVDPFSGGPLHYRVEGDGFVLYSVDRDGVDDGGTEGTRSKGDLVWTATR